MKRIIALYTSQSPAERIKAIGAWFTLCGMITDFTIQKLDNSNYISPDAKSYVQRAEEYIHQNISKQITVKEIAEYLNISVGYLHSVFKSVTKKSITQYVNSYKTEVAKQLILSRRLPLKDIKEYIGVSDPAYMSRMFKKETGYSYREFVSIAKP